MKRYLRLLAFLGALGGAPHAALAATVTAGVVTPTASLCINPTPGDAIATIDARGTWTGSLLPRGNLNGNADITLTPYTYGTSTSATINAVGTYQVPLLGVTQFCIRPSSLSANASVVVTTAPGGLAVATEPISGTVTANAGTGTFTVGGSTGMLTQTANGLKTDGSGVTQPVSGTFWQATQPVSGNVGITGALPAGSNALGSVTISSGGNTLAPNANGSLNASLYNAAGTSIATSVVGSSVAGGTGGVLGIQGVTGGVALPVSGTFWQTTQPVSGTFWQTTQPVSGTVTANQGGAPWSVTPSTTNNACLNPQNYQAGVISGTTSNVKIATHSGSTSIYVCGLSLQNEVATGTLSVVYGTGTNCATGSTTIDLRQGIISSEVLGYAGFPAYIIPANNDLCIFPSGTAPAFAGNISFVTQ